MKVVILAAGMGSRLGEHDHPKALTQLGNGKTILGQQLDSIAKISPLENVIVVVGYLEQMIMDKYPKLHYVHNTNYTHENTSKSLLKAIVDIHEDVLWMNGDVVFHPTILTEIMHYKRSCMAVNQTKVGEEEVKYRTDEQGMILEVSKEVRRGMGEAIGVNYFAKPDLLLLKTHLASCKPTDYFEKGIERCIQDGTKVKALPFPVDYTCEIDFPEDLVRANTFLTRWTN